MAGEQSAPIPARKTREKKIGQVKNDKLLVLEFVRLKEKCKPGARDIE